MKVSSGFMWGDGKNFCPTMSESFLETIGRKTSNDDSLVRYFATLPSIHRSDFSKDRLAWLSSAKV